MSESKPKLIKDKRFLKVLTFLEKSLGVDNAGLLVSFLADSLLDLTNGVEARNIRTVTICYNDYFKTKFDFNKGDFVNGD